MREEFILFEHLVKEYFKHIGFEVVRENNLDQSNYDLFITHDQISGAVEIKYSWSKKIDTKTLLTAAKYLAHQIQKDDRLTFGIVVTSSLVDEATRKDIEERTGIFTWDRVFLLNGTKSDIILRNKIEKLILSNDQLDQNIESLEVKENINPIQKIKDKKSIKGEQPEYKGKKLFTEIEKLKKGKKDWRKFEIKIKEALEYIFSEDLVGWHEQKRTNDGLNRYDLICRIASVNDYWKSLIRYYNTRYVLFEMKNYTKPIKQGQVYTTEKYLFKTALRSVAFLIARNGAEKNAFKAANGALKEHGKLIQILDMDDIEKLLKLKDNSDDPSSYLAEKLDDQLIKLSR